MNTIKTGYIQLYEKFTKKCYHKMKYTFTAKQYTENGLYKHEKPAHTRRF